MAKVRFRVVCSCRPSSSGGQGALSIMRQRVEGMARPCGLDLQRVEIHVIKEACSGLADSTAMLLVAHEQATKRLIAVGF